MKSHYDLLGVEPTDDIDTVKRAFRREIARYHPDKVSHLGPEFQEMASARAAELTVAYKTLTDPDARAQYDVSLASGAPPSSPPTSTPGADAPPAPDDGSPFRPPRLDEIRTPPPQTGSSPRFASERANRDQILRRAIAVRVFGIVEGAYGKLETPTVPGFELAMVPLAKPRFLGAPPPRVLVRIVEHADAAAMTDAFNAACRARVHAGKSPVVVLVFSQRPVVQAEVSMAHQAMARQRKGPDAPDSVAVLALNIADWSCHLPPDCPAVVRKLADQIGA